MKFKLEIDADNSAYEGESLHHEIALNLDAVRIKIERGYTQGIIKDTNGNIVGDFVIEED
jgi:hypothetical protein